MTQTARQPRFRLGFLTHVQGPGDDVAQTEIAPALSRKPAVRPEPELAGV